MKNNNDQGAAVISDVNALSASGPRNLITPELRINHDDLRANGLLRQDEWKAIDDAVVGVATQRLAVVSDLRAAGLVRDLNSLGVLIDQWEASSDMSDADVSMDGITPGREDAPDFQLQGVPIPIIHKDFRLSVRVLEASRKLGATVDTTGAEIATRKVSEAIESLVLSGTSKVRIGSNQVFGVLNHPDRNTGSITNWALVGTTGETIVAEVLAMISDAEAAHHYGPFALWIPTAYGAKLRGDFKANSDKTILQRILDIDSISMVRTVDRMPANNVVLVQLTRDVIDLSIGQDIAAVDWQTQGGLMQHFKVLAAMAPRVKSDHNGNSGVVHHNV